MRFGAARAEGASSTTELASATATAAMRTSIVRVRSLRESQFRVLRCARTCGSPFGSPGCASSQDQIRVRVILASNAGRGVGGLGSERGAAAESILAEKIEQNDAVFRPLRCA